MTSSPAFKYPRYLCAPRDLLGYQAEFLISPPSPSLSFVLSALEYGGSLLPASKKTLVQKRRARLPAVQPGQWWGGLTPCGLGTDCQGEAFLC